MSDRSLDNETVSDDTPSKKKKKSNKKMGLFSRNKKTEAVSEIPDGEAEVEVEVSEPVIKKNKKSQKSGKRKPIKLVLGLLLLGTGIAVAVFAKTITPPPQIPQVNINAPSPDLEGKVVFAKGQVSSPTTHKDDVFKVETNRVRLKRVAEMYQHNADGTARIWSEEVIESPDDSKMNPINKPIPSEEWFSEKESFRLGKLSLSPSITNKLNIVDQDRAFTAEDFSNLNDYGKKAFKLFQGSLVYGLDLDQPSIGDFRIRFNEAAPITISVLAKLQGGTLQPYLANGKTHVVVRENSLNISQITANATLPVDDTMLMAVRGAGGFVALLGLLFFALYAKKPQEVLDDSELEEDIESDALRADEESAAEITETQVKEAITVDDFLDDDLDPYSDEEVTEPAVEEDVSEEESDPFSEIVPEVPDTHADIEELTQSEDPSLDDSSENVFPYDDTEDSPFQEDGVFITETEEEAEIEIEIETVNTADAEESYSRGLDFPEAAYEETHNPVANVVDEFYGDDYPISDPDTEDETDIETFAPPPHMEGRPSTPSSNEMQEYLEGHIDVEDTNPYYSNASQPAPQTSSPQPVQEPADHSMAFEPEATSQNDLSSDEVADDRNYSAQGGSMQFPEGVDIIGPDTDFATPPSTPSVSDSDQPIETPSPMASQSEEEPPLESSLPVAENDHTHATSLEFDIAESDEANHPESFDAVSATDENAFETEEAPYPNDEGLAFDTSESYEASLAPEEYSAVEAAQQPDNQPDEDALAFTVDAEIEETEPSFALADEFDDNLADDDGSELIFEEEDVQPQPSFDTAPDISSEDLSPEPDLSEKQTAPSGLSSLPDPMSILQKANEEGSTAPIQQEDVATAPAVPEQDSSLEAEAPASLSEDELPEPPEFIVNDENEDNSGFTESAPASPASEAPASQTKQPDTVEEKADTSAPADDMSSIVAKMRSVAGSVDPSSALDPSDETSVASEIQDPSADLAAALSGEAPPSAEQGDVMPHQSVASQEMQMPENTPVTEEDLKSESSSDDDSDAIFELDDSNEEEEDDIAFAFDYNISSDSDNDEQK